MPGSRARAIPQRPGRASAPTISISLGMLSSRNAASTSCAIPPQPMKPTNIDHLLRIEPHARGFPLRQLFHGVTHTFAAKAARAHTAEGLGVEPKAAPVVDPAPTPPAPA